MTDNDIIKDWKWHISSVHCNGTQIYSAVVVCSRELAENTLDLINRQKVEIERLNDELHRARVEISKFYEYSDKYCNEAIDVFADCLKIKLNRMIDNLVKEMTEV